MDTTYTLKRAVLRSIVFNILFFICNALLCVVLLPCLLLPRRLYIGVIQGYHYIITALEYVVLGLRYEVRGGEYLPHGSPYIVAAKHQSLYETFKLRMLFQDPAIILKRELLKIPFWGEYLKKTDVIAIDRSNPEHARQSIADGALRVSKRGRPIVIFPQGTRVLPGVSAEQKPYKAGVYYIQHATGLPVIPMATNSGLFWPKKGFLKSSGKVTFQFFPPIDMQALRDEGLDKKDILDHVRNIIEPGSNALMQEAVDGSPQRRTSMAFGLFAVFFLLFGVYSFAWFKTADAVKREYVRTLYDLTNRDLTNKNDIAPPQISGFPFAIKLFKASETIKTNDITIDLSDIHARGWPIPLLPVHFETGSLSVRYSEWPAPLVFDSLTGQVSVFNQVVHMKDSLLIKGDFNAGLKGRIDGRQEPLPAITMELSARNHEALLADLSSSGIIEDKEALFAGFALAAFREEDGVVRVPITQREGYLYVGPFPIPAESLFALPRQGLRNRPAPSR